MNAQVQQWIDKAIADAQLQPWSKVIRYFAESARDMLNDWAEDGMFRAEQDVRERLCQWADSEIGQVGTANFNAALDEQWEVTDGDGFVVSTHATEEQAELAVAEDQAAYAKEYELAIKEGTRLVRRIRRKN